MFVYSATNKDNQAAPRTGFFYDFKPREMLIKKWDKYHEGQFLSSIFCH